MGILSPAVAWLENTHYMPYGTVMPYRSGVPRRIIQVVDDVMNCAACKGNAPDNTIDEDYDDYHNGYPQVGCPCMDLTRPNNNECHHKDKPWQA